MTPDQKISDWEKRLGESPCSSSPITWAKVLAGITWIVILWVLSLGVIHVFDHFNNPFAHGHQYECDESTVSKFFFNGQELGHSGHYMVCTNKDGKERVFTLKDI